MKWVFTKETIALKVFVIVLIFITTYARSIISNKIVIQIFNVKTKNEVKAIMIQGTILSLARIFINSEAYRFIDIIVVMTMYKYVFDMTTEKTILAEEINISTILITETLIMKVLFSTIPSSIGKIDGYQYKIVASMILCTLKLILYKIAINKNIRFQIRDGLQDANKLKIIAVSVLSLVLIVSIELGTITNIATIPTYLYVLINAMLLLYFATVMNIAKDISIMDEADETIVDLEESKERLQEDYDNVRSFRHDFNNIMQGMGGYISTNDINGLKQMYTEIVGECQEMNDNRSLSKEIINNPAVYQLINNKFKKAKEYKIRFRINVFVDINQLNISPYDLCRILGILLDNAIEAAKDCENKVINIRFIKDKINNRNLVIIENAYKNYLIDLNKIYDKGFTSKKDKFYHGLGLWKVKQIIKKNKNLNINTTRGDLFRQELEIY